MLQLVKNMYTWCNMVSFPVYQQISSDVAFTTVKSYTAISSNNT